MNAINYNVKETNTLTISELGLIITKSLSKEVKKEEGIYFTPLTIINKCYELLFKYLDLSKEISVCEPSCGSLEFITNDNFNKIQAKNIVCYELNKFIYDSILYLQNDNIKIINNDYLTSSVNDKYDLIIGNPPYFVTKNKLYNEYYTGRPNIYIQFIIHSLLKLNTNGILCFVIPLTLLSSKYYEKTRNFIKTILVS